MRTTFANNQHTHDKGLLVGLPQELISLATELEVKCKSCCDCYLKSCSPHQTHKFDYYQCTCSMKISLQHQSLDICCFIHIILLCPMVLSNFLPHCSDAHCGHVLYRSLILCPFISRCHTYLWIQSEKKCRPQHRRVKLQILILKSSIQFTKRLLTQ